MKIVILISFFFLPLFGVQKVTLQLNWLNQFQFAGYYVAKEMGYYKDAGIDVQINEFNATTDISTVIQDKKADFAVGRSSLLIDKSKGKDIVALGAIFQQSPLILLVRDDTHINSVGDLKNKRIMLTDDAAGSAPIMAMLFSNGLNRQDVKIVPHSFNLDDLINKKVDAMASYISNEPIQMAEKGVRYKVFNPKDFGFHFYSDILFTSSAFIKKNPQLTRKFYQATIKGWEYAFENISHTSEIIYKHYNTQHKTLIHLIKEAEVLKKLAYKKNIKLGYIDKNQLNDTFKVYKVLGLITHNIDIDSFIYEYNHPKEVAFKLSYDEIFHIAIVFVLLFISMSFIVFVVIIRKKWLLRKSDLKKQIAEQKEKIDKQNRIIMVQSKIAAIGEMLSNIAHQWRQPLNVISLSTAKMETAILLGTEMRNEDLLEITNEINIQSQYLSQTIDDFRNYFNSNTESITDINLQVLVNSVNVLSKESFKNSGIELMTDIQECTLRNNESLLVQALLNIYNNAKDAMLENKTEHKYFFVDAKCKEGMLTITLKDSAGGIEENIIDKIFEPYFTTKHKSNGTGLGLYITYGIITQHFHGTISVRNVEFDYMDNTLHGAEFIVVIPIKM